MRDSGFSGAQRIYVAALVLVSIASILATTAVQVTVVRSPPLVALVCLALFGFVAEYRTGKIRGAKSLSLTAIAMLAALPLAGLFGSVVVAFCSMALLPTKLTVSVRVFNTATITLCAVVGAFGYSICGGISPIERAVSANTLIIHVLLPLIVATMLNLAVNVTCVGIMVSLASGQPLSVSLLGVVTNVWTLYPAYAIIAFVLAVLWAPVDLGPVSFLPIVAPLLIAQWSIGLRAQEYEAHLRTIETLVAASQAGQPMLRGRSVWVDAVSRELGIVLRLSAADMEALQHAALLHDIGLIAPASLSPGVQLTGPERDWIRAHPRQGVRMLDGIDFLAESCRAAEHHHERWDGRGYPDGLAQMRIPQLARVLSVADAYCALLLAEAGRPDADMTELGFRTIAGRSLIAVRAGAGTQFDPAVVDALQHAQGRVAQVCLGLLGDSPPAPMTGVDPHLPWVSDMFAETAESNETVLGS